MAHRNANGARRSSLTDLDPEAQQRLIEEHEERLAAQAAARQEPKLPSFGVEDIDSVQTPVPALTIGLGRLMLGSAAKSSNGPKGSQLTESGFSGQSEQSIDSDEENDKVAHMMEDLSAFRQLDYLWLFDKDVKFSERPDFTLDDHNVTAEDFQKMRQINRGILTQFFKERNQIEEEDEEEDTDVDMDAAGEEGEAHREASGASWADENLDEEIKTLLANYENGRDLPVDIVSHLEYFYNTLECTFRTKNPFEQPGSYPCLMYRVPTSSAASSSSQHTHGEKTLFEKHRAIIYPNSNTEKSKSASKSHGSSDISPCAAGMLLHVSNQQSMNTNGNSQGSYLTQSAAAQKMRFHKQYYWYPNEMIISPSCKRVTYSPSPKVFQGKALQKDSVAVAKNPYRRVSHVYANPQSLALKPVPTHMAQNFGDCVDMQQEGSNYLNPESAAAAQENHPLNQQRYASVPQNVSAIKGKQMKQLRVTAQYSTNGEQHQKQQHETNSATLAQQRRMTLLDQPLVDGGKFDVLTVSALDQAKTQDKGRSVLVQNMPDFDFDSFM